MTSFFGKGPSVNQPDPPATGLRIQSSVNGKPIPIGYGSNRVSGNLIGYWDFAATAVNSSPQGSGKGVGGGGGGKGSSGQVSYIYAAAIAMGLCEGPIITVTTAWNAKTKVALADLNMTLFLGDYAQTAWGYLVSLHPADALNYRGQAYVAAGPMQLGNTQELPNLSFEIHFGIANAYSGVPDANPKDVVIDYLTNTHYGLLFPAARLGPLTTFSNYCVASGLPISPVETEHRPASDFLRDVFIATNSEAVWSSGVLTVVPYGDQSITANGATYTAPSAPIYSLGEDDFIQSSGGGASLSGPMVANRTRVSDQMNSVSIEYLDRQGDYNPAITEAKDDAAITLYGLRPKGTTQLHMFTLTSAASQSAQLLLGREQVRNTFTFTLPAKYILLDPMDLIAITDVNLGLSGTIVRIREIQENSDRTLTVTAEEYLGGAGSTPIYGQQANSGNIPNYNQAPGETQNPLFFEPTDSLAGDLEVWMAIAGVNSALWGGCDVWVSYDDITYRNMGRLHGPSRYGTLTAQLPIITAASTGATIDSVNTLAVDLALSLGQLASGSLGDMLSFNTLCWVDGEFLSYQTAALVAGNAYHLTTLNRGGYNTNIGTHAIGSSFARIDDGIFRLPYTQDRIGATVFIKPLSFNIWGGGLQSLSDVGAHTYVLQGTALSSPLPDVQNFTSVYQSNVLTLSWDEVKDFRPVQYEIRKGTDWASGQILGRFAHPPAPTQGDGTYFISAYSQPAAGLQVYSAHQASLSLTGTVLPLNIAASWNEFTQPGPPAGPAGTFSGTAFYDGTEIRTGAGGDILAAADVLAIADVYNFGGQGNGIYEIPASHQIDVGRVAPCLVAITWTFAGVATTNNFFAYNPLFDVVDFFGSSSNQLVNVYPDIALSQDGSTFAAWQKYSAGTYNARKFKARQQLQTFDPNVAAFLTSFIFTVYAPTRNDHWASILGVRTSLTNLTLPAAGSTLTFIPDTQTGVAPFNGGVSNATRPNVFVTIIGAQPGDIPIILGPSGTPGTVPDLTGCFVQVTNNGVGVSRVVNILPEGF